MLSTCLEPYSNLLIRHPCLGSQSVGSGVGEVVRSPTMDNALIRDCREPSQDLELEHRKRVPQRPLHSSHCCLLLEHLTLP